MGLILRRRCGEGVWIGEMFVRVKQLSDGSCRLHISGPRSVAVQREEIDRRVAPDRSLAGSRIDYTGVA